MKKIVAALCLLCHIFIFTVAAYSEEYRPCMYIDGHAAAPVREIAEAAGAAISYDSASETVTIIKDKIRLSVRNGSCELSVSGSMREMPFAAFNSGGRIWLPLRLVTESLGCSVEWDPVLKAPAVLNESGKKTYFNAYTIPLNNEKLIALTFDDGPSVYTSRILDALKENGVNATFFMLGCNLSAYPDLLSRLVNEGNEIGNHTYGHSRLTQLSVDNIKVQIEKTQSAVLKYTGILPCFFRPPYGAFNSTVLSAAGIPAVLWNADPRDWECRDSNEIAYRVLHVARDGMIVVMHDTNPGTASALQILLPALAERGFRVVTVSGLFKGKGIEPVAGKAYFSSFDSR